MKSKTALVSGITGQDGSYLAELLLEKEYQVIGLHRRTSTNHFERIMGIMGHPKFHLHEFDLCDSSSVYNSIDHYQPDEFYNLAAQSHVATSFNQPSFTFDVNTQGVVNILEAIKNYSPNTKLYQAGTSEMFGRNHSKDKNGVKYQDETTQFLPQSPYGVSKLASHRMLQIYREAYGIFASNGILFNHESPRRGSYFVTQKIVLWIKDFFQWCRKNNITPVEVKSDDENLVFKDLSYPKLRLGNLKAKRDWGHARDYVKAMYLMLQQNESDDYVISSDTTNSIEDFVSIAFNHVGIKDYSDYIYIDPKFYRPAEVDYLCGKSTKAREKLGWKPLMSLNDLVVDMLNE